MKKNYFKILIPSAFLFVTLFFGNLSCSKKKESLTILYPYDLTVFPKDIAPPSFAWKDTISKTEKWIITLKTDKKLLVDAQEVTGKEWKPKSEIWKSIIEAGPSINYTFTVKEKSGSNVAKVNFTISKDAVNSAIFYRSVPLPFKFARENLKNIKWYLGDISSEEKPHALMEDMPVCANCHSFSQDGKTIGMDVDAIDDKGAYALTSFQESTKFATDSIMSWSNFQKGKFTYGLLSQVSPNGRYVVSTLHDCEIFVDRKELEYSQLFFPFKGILVIYDRKEKRFFELKGANDTTLVQSNPSWTPDGKNILFVRARAKHFEESGIHNGSVPKEKDKARYKVFEKHFLDRDSLFKFDIYTIPFNEGKGGKATPVEGASNNGLSNYFPKVSPDGKWLVFCQAESFMLLQKDSKLVIMPMPGGKTQVLKSNGNNMNSWHSWSPNSKWLLFSSKALGPYTQLFITHINDDGTDTPPIYLRNFSTDKYANNIPEFVNNKYSKKFKIEPDFLSDDLFLIRHGEMAQKKGDDKLAFEAFSKAIQKFPNNSDAYYKRGLIYYQQNQFPEALKDLNKAVELNKYLNHYVTRGMIKLKMGDYPSAIIDLKEALKIDSTDNKSNSQLGVAYTQLQKPDIAIPYFKKALKVYKEDYFSYYNLGRAYYTKGAFRDAKTSFNLGIENCQDSTFLPKLFEMRGNSQANLSNFEAAIADFNIAINYEPRDPSLYFGKAKVLLVAGREAEAINLLQQAAKLGSQQAASLLNSIAKQRQGL